MPGAILRKVAQTRVPLEDAFIMLNYGVQHIRLTFLEYPCIPKSTVFNKLPISRVDDVVQLLLLGWARGLLRHSLPLPVTSVSFYSTHEYRWK